MLRKVYLQQSDIQHNFKRAMIVKLYASNLSSASFIHRSSTGLIF